MPSVLEQHRLRPLLKMNQAKIKVCVDTCRVNNGNSWQWWTTFIGQEMQHNYWLYYLLDGIMASNPQIESIVEIGTGNGALATFLGLWGVKRTIPVMTIDWDKDKSEEQKKVLIWLGIRRLYANVLTPDTQEAVVAFTRNKPVLLVVDGWHKDREFNLYAPQVAAGSIIGVHDYQTEWFMKDIQEIADKYCEPYNRDKWTEMNVQFAVFRRK